MIDRLGGPSEVRPVAVIVSNGIPRQGKGEFPKPPNPVRVPFFPFSINDKNAQTFSFLSIKKIQRNVTTLLLHLLARRPAGVI